MPNVDDTLTELYEEIADCPACPLARTRSQTVPGSGPAAAEVMLIGEAPGAREDEQGLPFVGPAGRFLDELLAAAELSRETVLICNVVKCRPPANRDPQPEEIAACRPFLDRQINIVNPKVIVTLGRFSMAHWFTGTTISRVHGQPRRADGRIVMPMYHPAAALHQGALRKVILDDFATLPALLHDPATVDAPPSSPPPALIARPGDAKLPQPLESPEAEPTPQAQLL